MYRYTDIDGSRRSIYAKTLNDLREKEKEIQLALNKNESLILGKITVADLVDNYLKEKKNLKINTINSYRHCEKIIKESKIAYMEIKDIKPNIAKNFFIDEYERGISYPTLEIIKNGILYPAFRQAYENEYINRNPFDCKINIPKKNKKEKKALTQKEKTAFLQYTKSCEKFYQIYLISNFILNTGLRVSELSGITFDSIDFDKRLLSVNKQLQYDWVQKMHYISTPKSATSNRVIPLNDTAYEIVCELKIKKRNNNPVIDNISDFVFLTPDEEICDGEYLRRRLRVIVKKYNETHDFQLPNITPHILRHTFCSNLAKNIDVKTLQYLMGHSSSSITLDIYTHVNLQDNLSTVTSALNNM